MSNSGSGTCASFGSDAETTCTSRNSGSGAGLARWPLRMRTLLMGGVAAVGIL